ncbi:MAG: hypothetical protein ACRDFS_09625, partial [Chloroflexota bacterium]
LEVTREMAAARANGEREVILARHEIAAAVKARGISRQSINSAWKPLERRGCFRLVEPGSVAVMVPR